MRPAPGAAFVWRVLLLALLPAAIASPGEAQSVYATPYTFTTIAGNAGAGWADGPASLARLNNPEGVACDAAGNVYVGDSGNGVIRKITPDGTVTTLAGRVGTGGFTDGQGGDARLADTVAMTTDAAGNLYTVDGGQRVRKITPEGVVTTLAGAARIKGAADGSGSAALFRNPGGIAVDANGMIYVADTDNHAIRRITPDGVVTTWAGELGTRGSSDGPLRASRFSAPVGIAAASDGTLYVAEMGNAVIRQITTAGQVTTLAGKPGQTGSVDGTGSAARFLLLRHLAVAADGTIYVTDGDNVVRRITAAGVVTTLAGSTTSSGTADGTGAAARFNSPSGLAIGPDGTIHVTDYIDSLLRKISPAGVVTTWIGTRESAGSVDGTAGAARFRYPAGVAIDAAGNRYVADNGNHTIRKITPAGVVTTLAGSPGIEGSADGPAASARFSQPVGVAVDAAGNVYVADTGNSTIRKISGGKVTTLAGTAGYGRYADGTGAAARFANPMGVAVDASGNVYVADTYNDVIRKISPSAVVTTLAGQAGQAGSTDGAGSAARFEQPTGIAIGPAGTIYVTSGLAVRQVTTGGVVTTLAGRNSAYGWVDGSSATAAFYQPAGIAVDQGGTVYLADEGAHVIRAIEPDGTVTTLGGRGGVSGSADGTGSDARFFLPHGIAVDVDGAIVVADTDNNVIRRGTFEAPHYRGNHVVTVGIGAAWTWPLEFTGAPTSYSVGVLPEGLSFDPATATIAGTATVEGDTTVGISATNAAGTTSLTIVISVVPAVPAQVVFWGQDSGFVYDGQPHELPWYTIPGDLEVAVTYNGSPEPPVDAGTYTVVGTIVAPGYTGSASVTLVVQKVSNYIDFAAIATQKAGRTIPLVASSSHDLPVTFTVLSGPATVAGDQLTLTGAGIVTVRASQPGNQNYAAAADVDRTFTVLPANTAPTLTRPANATMAKNGTQTFAFEIADVDTGAAGLDVTTNSSDPTLIPASALVLGGTGARRTVTVTPAANRTGTARITLTATDPGALSASVAFNVTVANAPAVSRVADQTMNEDTTRAVAIKLSDADTAASSLKLTATSSNARLLPSSGLVLSGSGANRTLTLKPAKDANGTATITLTVTDGALSSGAAFKLAVKPVNDAPTISRPAGQVIAKNGTTTLAVTVGDAETAASGLKLTATSSDPSLFPAGTLVTGGSGATRSVKLTPAKNRTGKATITLTVSDGFLKTAASFPVVVQNAPTIAKIADQTTTEDTTTPGIAVRIGDVETAASKLTLSVASSNAKLLPASGLVIGGSGTNRTLRIKPAANQNGTATVTLTVSDGTLSASTSFKVKVTAVNDAPTITGPASFLVGATAQQFTCTVADVDTPVSDLTVTAETVPAAARVFVLGSFASRTVELRRVSGNVGSFKLVLTVSDGRATGRWTVQVNDSRASAAPGARSLPRLAFTAEPLDQVVKAGAEVRLKAEVREAGEPTWRWTRDGQPVPGARSSTLVLPAVQLTDAGGYAVTASGPSGAITSGTAELTVVEMRTAATRRGPMLAVTQTLTVAGAADAMSLTLLLPDGWRYVSGATAGAASAPKTGDTALLEWRWTRPPPGPVTFTYLLDLPVAATLPQALEALGEIRVNGAATKLRFDLGLGR